MKIIIFSFLISFASIFATDSPIYPKEAHNELEVSSISSLEISLNEFIERGGTIIRLEGDVEPFQFHTNDVIFPACSAGYNRSQIIWNLFRPYSEKVLLNKPHATQFGFDPFNGKANWFRVNAVEKDEFEAWAGVPRSEKFGYELFSKWLSKKNATEEELNWMLDYYNRAYYHPEHLNGLRRIYITFAKNAHIHLFRLNQTNESLENVIVLFFPIEDLVKTPLPDWKTYPGSKKCYKELAKIVSSHLDFSAL